MRGVEVEFEGEQGFDVEFGGHFGALLDDFYVLFLAEF